MISELTVIDASTVLAGPSAATYFAELGAKVIKVEHPHHPDVTRSWKLPKEDKTSTVSAYFSSVNCGKKYVPIDLSSNNGYADFLNLVSEADILIMNFKPADYEKFNIKDEILHFHNSRLIIGKINGYGEDSNRVAYDLILQAESGFMSMNGTTESGPVKMPVALIDVLSAHHLKEAILLALYERSNTKKGKSVSVSLYDAAISSLTNQASNYLMQGHVPKRIGSLHPNIAPYGELFTSKDEQQITFAIGSNTHFEKLCGVLDLNHLPINEKYNTNQQRLINRSELEVLISKEVEKRNSEDLLNQLKSLNVPAGKIKSIDEVFEDEKASSLIRTEEIDGLQTKRVTSVIFK